MTDEEWSNLTHWLKLPDATRHPIENELDLYRRFAAATASAPSDTRDNLERAAQMASKLLKAIEAFGPEEHRAFVVRGESVGPTPRLDALKLLTEQHAQLTALRDRMATAAANVGRGKTGSNANNARALVKRVSEIVETCTGTPLSKGKPELYFAEKLGRLADPPISANSIKGAIETLEPKKLAAEKSANYG